jgi:peptidoglycan/xylan/chitin deacetylase (PgdA/CDA1 family)
MIKNPIPWPNGARCACAITFDMDADSLIHIARPKDSHDRLYPITMGRYGPTVAVPRILDTYRKFDLKQSFFIPAWCIEQYPAAIEAILKDGHEIGHHGLIHEDPVTTKGKAQKAAFEKALEIHKKRIGKLPRGYRAPLYNVTQQVVDLLIAKGFLYDSSLMADDIPYLMKTKRGGLWEAPTHWGTDDWPPFAHYAEIDYLMPVKAPSEGLKAFWEEFEAQYDAGGFWMGIWHPFLTGRLARWRQVEQWLDHTLKTKKVWFASLEEIINHVRMLSASGQYQPRVEQLPYFKGAVRP